MSQERFATWLKRLAQMKKGPFLPGGASRGRPWSAGLVIPGDWSSATFRGEVRSQPDAGTILATFAFTAPSFDGEKTTVTMSLASGTGANSTGILPSDNNFDGVEYFPFDVLVDFGGTEDLFFGGVLPVAGRITV
jgi:hypothetical protein